MNQKMDAKAWLDSLIEKIWELKKSCNYGVIYGVSIDPKYVLHKELDSIYIMDGIEKLAEAVGENIVEIVRDVPFSCDEKYFMYKGIKIYQEI